MTIKELYHRNEQFQQQAAQIAELPGTSLLGIGTSLIRGAQMLDRYLIRILEAKVAVRFYQAIESLEEEMDEMIYLMDKLDIENRKTHFGMINEFLKRGYELLSLYSQCCDQLLEQKAKNKNELK